MTDLITRLEEAAEGSRELDEAIYDALGATRVRSCIAGLSDDVGGLWMYQLPGDAPSTALRVTTSLDAALALAERLHPCWSWSVGQNVHHKYWRAYALALDTDRAAFQPTEATSKTPALAICIAILKANHKDKP